MNRHRFQGDEGEARRQDRTEAEWWEALGFSGPDIRDELHRRERVRREAP